jgi:hypothetical protein
LGAVTGPGRRAFVSGLLAAGASATGLAFLNGCGIVLRSAVRPTKSLGYLSGDPPDSPWARVLWDRLRELGWVEGNSLVIERRFHKRKVS